MICIVLCDGHVIFFQGNYFPCSFLFSFVLGMITLGNLMAKIVAGKITPETHLSGCIYSKFKKVYAYVHLHIFVFVTLTIL